MITKPTYDELEQALIERDNHLAILTTAHQQAVEENVKLQQKIAQQRRGLSGKNESWATTKLGLLREIERWRAKANGEEPTFGHGAKRDEITFQTQHIAELKASLQQVVKERDELLENLSLCKGNELAAEVDTLRAQLSESHDSIQSAAGVVADLQASLQQAVEALAGVRTALKEVLQEAVILPEDYLSAFHDWPLTATIQGWDKARWLRALEASKKARAAIHQGGGGT